MPQLALALFGSLQLTRGGELIATRLWAKTQALLAYLAIEAALPHRREALAGLLWPEEPDRAARTSLRQALWQLRHLTASESAGFLSVTPQTVQFSPADGCSVDVAEFSALLEACDAHPHRHRQACPDCAKRLERALALYHGDLLAGFSLADSVAFEEWALVRREQLRRLALSALADLAEHHGLCGAYGLMEQLARRQVELDPFRESAHRQIMRALAWSGQRNAALVHYEALSNLLAQELGVPPEQETTALHERLRAGELPASFSPAEPAPQAPLFLGTHEPERVAAPIFVSRAPELARLDGFLAQALAGRGQVALVTGEAGEGKSALIAEFARQAQAAHPDLIVAAGSGNAHTGVGDPYLPFREILGLLTGDVEARWAAGAMPRAHALRLWRLLPLAAEALVDVGPDLVDTFVAGSALMERALAFAHVEGEGDAAWLSRLERLLERRAPAAGGAANVQQSDLLEQYARVLELLARARPLLLVLDDLQWADEGSANLLSHLGRRLAGSRILLVGAYRPAELAQAYAQRERHPLQPVVNELKRRLGDVEIALDRAEEISFVDALLDSEPNRLGRAFRDTLYRQTRGHPLFTVELLRGMQERGDLVRDAQGRWIEGPALDWERLPARVEAVIAERIGRLPQHLRELLAVAGVEGETFTAEVLARVLGTPEREIVRCLSGELDARQRLVVAQGIRRQGSQRLSRYRFRHILFQKYLYQSLDPVARAHVHETVGGALEACYGEALEDVVVQLARHFQEAGVAEKAVDYLRRAGERAVRLSANPEAIAHFSRALELIGALADSRQRAEQELALQMGLAVPLLAERGYAAPEVGHACARARSLCQQIGEAPQLFPVLLMLAVFYGNQGNHDSVHEITEQLLGLAERSADPELANLTYWLTGWHLLFTGELTSASVRLRHNIAFYDPLQHRALAYLYGQDLGVTARSCASWALWLLGYPQQALERSQEAIALARELGHPHSLALALGYACILHTLVCDLGVQALAEECIHLCTEHGFAYWLPTGWLSLGWMLTIQGQAEKGIRWLRQGMAAHQATGARLSWPQQLALLAAAYGRSGRVEEGLGLLAEALDDAERSGERYYEAEIHRLRGELLLMRGAGAAEAEAEAHYGQAIEVARQQGAKSWELRATMSLCRLWQQQGKSPAAHARLREIYAWFTEGFDTPDLEEAQALLRALEAAVR